jgi:hypothetical protein
MPVVGPLLVSAPVGGGEAHAAGPGAPTCVDREVFSSNKVFSITTSRGISITTSFSLLSFFALQSFPSPQDPSPLLKTFGKVFFDKKEISNEYSSAHPDYGLHFDTQQIWKVPVAFYWTADAQQAFRWCA